MRVGVLDISQTPHIHTPTRFVSKNAASALVRRLVAVQITRTLIQMVEVRAMSKQPLTRTGKVFHPATYEHHIEPKLTALTIDTSPWMRYLAGMQ